MTRRVPIQSWLPPEAAVEVRAHCTKCGMTLSEFIRTLVIEACASGLGENRLERQLGLLLSDLNFAAVALDALLSGHPDPGLRGRVHEAFNRKEAHRAEFDSSRKGAGQ